MLLTSVLLAHKNNTYCKRCRKQKTRKTTLDACRVDTAVAHSRTSQEETLHTLTLYTQFIHTIMAVSSLRQEYRSNAHSRGGSRCWQNAHIPPKSRCSQNQDVYMKLHRSLPAVLFKFEFFSWWNTYNPRNYRGSRACTRELYTTTLAAAVKAKPSRNTRSVRANNSS